MNILYEAGLDTNEALNLIKMDRPFRRIRSLVTIYYRKYTTHRFDIIDKLFLSFELKKISDKAQSKSKKKLSNVLLRY